MAHHNQEMFASKVAIAGGGLLFLISAGAGIVTDSVSLLLDAATALVTVAIAFFVRQIIMKINNPPDHLYHFGYEKFEPLSVVVQNVALLATCLFGAKTAFQDLIHPEPLAHAYAAAGAALASGVLAIAIALFLRRVATQTGSAVLKAAAAHWFIDSTLSFGMGVGFVFSMYLVHLGHHGVASHVDPAMAIILSLILVKGPIKSLSMGFFELLDGAPEAPIHDHLQRLAREAGIPADRIERLRFRQAGRKLFVEVRMLVDEQMTLNESLTLTERLERDIAAIIPRCDCVVHFRKQVPSPQDKEC
jgi:cation diffusion facilitator family transporter